MKKSLSVSRRVCRSVVVVAASLAFAPAVPATASAAYPKLGDFASGPGSGVGQLARPGKVAVDSAGNLLVADSGNNRIAVFAPGGDAASFSGEFGGQTLNSPVAVAVDSGSGAVYISDSNGIQKFTASHDQAAGWSPPAGVSGPLAVNQASHELVVGDTSTDTAVTLDANGAVVGTFSGSSSPGGAFTGILDVAVAPDGDVIVVDSATGSIADVVQGISASRVERFDQSGGWQRTLGPIQGGAGAVSVGQVTGHVFVAGNYESYNNNNPLHVSVFDGDGADLAGFDLIGPGPLQPRSTIYAMISGLSADEGHKRVYVATDLDPVDADGPVDYGSVTVQVHRAPVPDLPVATTRDAADSEVGATTAKLFGRVTPSSLPTRYWFEWGTTTSYGSQTPAAPGADAGSEDDPVDVAKVIFGLAPETTYHYRVVARNGLGTAVGADKMFTTHQVVGRQEPAGGARGYELVSPPDKNGGAALDLPFSSKASVTGDGFIFESLGVFAGAQGLPLGITYIARRSADGWHTTSLTPPFQRTFDNNHLPLFKGYSDDLSHVALITGDPPLAPGAEAETANLYVRDTTRTPQEQPYQLVTPTGPKLDSEYTPAFAGASSDWQHVLFQSVAALTPDAPANARVNLYKWDQGKLSLVATPSGAGSFAGGFDPGFTLPGAHFDEYGAASAMSEDGQRVYVTDAGDGQVYLHEGDAVRQVSLSQKSVPEPPSPVKPSSFLGATKDGAKAFFLSTDNLTDDANVSTMKLYRYDVASSTLVNLSSGGGGVRGMAGFSTDGQSAVFVADDVLAAGATAGRPNMYYWHNGQLRFVTLLADDLTEGATNWHSGYQLIVPRSARLSEDGRYLLFSSTRPQTDYDTSGTRQFYRFDADTNEIVCVSCSVRLSRSVSSASAFKETAFNSKGNAARTNLARLMSADGGRVMFETADALVSSDTNGRSDVYLWESGEIRLISTGHGSSGAHFLDASVNGDDVFFATDERLVESDKDDAADVYDARIGGGLPQQAPSAPCDGDACQGVASSPPSMRSPGSDAVSREGPPELRRPKAARLTVASATAGVGSVLKLSVTVSSAGKLSITGRAVAKTSTVLRRSGRHVVGVRLSRAAAASLRRRHSVKATVRVTFVPTGGTSASKTVRLTFKPSAAKRGHPARKTTTTHKAQKAVGAR